MSKRVAPAACLVALFVLSAAALGASNPPATQNSAGSVDLRDYCTVLLATKLQDHLNVSDDQRKQFADMKTKLYAYLHNAAGNFGGPSITPGMIAARTEVVLNKIGTNVQDVLTPEQRQTLAQMFDDKTLRPIKISAEVEHGRSLRGGTSVTTGVALDYTHYGESNRGKAAAPTTSAAGSAATAQAATTAPSAKVSASTGGKAAAGDGLIASIALDGLKAEQPIRRAHAAKELERAAPDDTYRPQVLAALRPLVKDPSVDHWVNYVDAYCNWADAGELETVQSILTDADKRTGMGQKEEAAAAACTALVRLKPAAAIDAINAHADEFFFRVRLDSDLKKLAPTDPVAANVEAQLKRYKKGTPITLPQ